MSKKPASKRASSRKKEVLSKFIVGLATDPAKMERLKADPEGVMNKAGLNAKEKAIIRSGNPEVILANIDPKFFGNDRTFHVIIVRVIITVKPVIAAGKKVKK
jgi:hypothetical protein